MPTNLNLLRYMKSGEALQMGSITLTRENESWRAEIRGNYRAVFEDHLMAIGYAVLFLADLEDETLENEPIGNVIQTDLVVIHRTGEKSWNVHFQNHPEQFESATGDYALTIALGQLWYFHHSLID